MEKRDVSGGMDGGATYSYQSQAESVMGVKLQRGKGGIGSCSECAISRGFNGRYGSHVIRLPSSIGVNEGKLESWKVTLLACSELTFVLGRRYACCRRRQALDYALPRSHTAKCRGGSGVLGWAIAHRTLPRPFAGCLHASHSNPSNVQLDPCALSKVRR